MADPRFNVHKKEEAEDWLMSYADMITLLMAFFVLLISMSHIDPVKYEKVKSGVERDITKKTSEQPLQQLGKDMAQVVKGLKLDETQVGIGSDDRGLVLEFDGNTFFEPASAKLRDSFVPALMKMVETLNSPRYSAFQIEVQGHTDDTPISTPAYPSNWELSAGRATMVVRLFILNGIAATRLSAQGLADTRPKVPNRDANNNPLAVNQSINRRVSVHIFPR